jgi:hypothetical protein
MKQEKVFILLSKIKDDKPTCASPELIDKELHRAYFGV